MRPSRELRAVVLGTRGSLEFWATLHKGLSADRGLYCPAVKPEVPKLEHGFHDARLP